MQEVFEKAGHRRILLVFCRQKHGYKALSALAEDSGAQGFFRVSMGSFLKWAPIIVGHPYKKDPKRDPNLENPKRDPNLENYPDGSGILGFGDSGVSPGFACTKRM